MNSPFNTSAPIVVRCGGVPEFLNLPCRMASENGVFLKHGIDLQWKQFPGGSGAMSKALRTNKLDMAIMLTEGAVVDLANGGPFKIVGFYMDSPLHWGIYVLNSSLINHPDQLQGMPFAVSTLNSGSHLMARLYAEKMHWNHRRMQFIETFGIHGAIIAMKVGIPRILVWDKFLAKPYVNSGEIRLLDECVTPWRSMVVAVREDLLLREPEAIQTVLHVIRQTAYEIKSGSFEKENIRDHGLFSNHEFRLWLEEVQWNTDGLLHINDLMCAYRAMRKLGVIRHNQTDHDFIERFSYSPALPNVL